MENSSVFRHVTPVVFSALFIATPLFAQWGPDIQISVSDSTEYLSEPGCRSIAVGPSNTVHVVWRDQRDHGFQYLEIYYKRSTDNGTTWGSDVRLTNSQFMSAHSAIAVSGNYVHVVWHDNRDGNNEIYYKRSTDSGATWGVDVRLTNAAQISQTASVAASGAVVHVAWRDRRDGDDEIYYKRSTDNGATWPASPAGDMRLTNAVNLSMHPTIGVNGNNVHLAWSDGRDLGDSNCDIYYKRSTDAGVNWGADTRITTQQDQSRWPSLAVSGSSLHVAFYDQRDNPGGYGEVYYLNSTDNGISWSADRRLSDLPDGSGDCNIAASGNNVHLVFWDARHGGAWEGEIYYKYSSDNGINWSVDTRLTNAPNPSGHPFIAVADTVLHVIWQDKRPTLFDKIWYKRNLNGNSGLHEAEPISNSKWNQKYRVVPNPFVNYSAVLGHEHEVFSLYDAAGKLVATCRGGRIGEGLAPGVYFLRPEDKSSKPVRIVKVR
jgi:hypothetical protein